MCFHKGLDTGPAFLPSSIARARSFTTQAQRSRSFTTETQHIKSVRMKVPLYVSLAHTERLASRRKPYTLEFSQAQWLDSRLATGTRLPQHVAEDVFPLIPRQQNPRQACS